MLLHPCIFSATLALHLSRALKCFGRNENNLDASQISTTMPAIMSANVIFPLLGGSKDK
jgi:hypothetical protein